jgi:ABC-type lipoprotein release transport system permease subunit
VARPSELVEIHLLFEIGPGDPATVVLAAVALAAVTLAAAYIPAARAARVSPVDGIRADC